MTFAVDRLYFRQLLAGRDFARNDQVARQMVNFVYLIGDRETRETVIVDPAYNIQDLLDLVAGDDMTVTGVLATHYHPDHVGGDLWGNEIEGVRTLLEHVDVPVHIQEEEQQWVKAVTGVQDDQLVTHKSADTVRVGGIEIELIHTPGHTPGSQCFLCEGMLISGDTLFLEGCGRTDLPGSDVVEMFHSLHDRLAKVPDETVLFPGHLYSSDSSASMADTRKWNYVFSPQSEAEWLRMFGGPGV